MNNWAKYHMRPFFILFAHSCGGSDIKSLRGKIIKLLCDDQHVYKYKDGFHLALKPYIGVKFPKIKKKKKFLNYTYDRIIVCAFLFLV